MRPEARWFIFKCSDPRRAVTDTCVCACEAAARYFAVRAFFRRFDFVSIAAVGSTRPSVAEHEKLSENCFCLAIQLFFIGRYLLWRCSTQNQLDRPSTHALHSFKYTRNRDTFANRANKLRHAFGHLPAPNAQRLVLFFSLLRTRTPTQRSKACFLTSVRWRLRDRPIQLAGTRDRRPRPMMLLREPGVRRRTQ